MATEQKYIDTQCKTEPRTWPVSLLGCLSNSATASQHPWPWLLFKAIVCPAAVLGANETLFQGEDPADICCLQPYSWCGPTCRGLNAQLCGFGNEGLKLCAHTCLLQAACSCFCLGLPYVAWLAALQRQRVATRHGVAVSDEDAWATACYPCSLMQMHALLQQQHQLYQQQVLSAPQLKPPKVQQMTATAASEQSACQAPSQAGPLTSGITSSKVLRAVRDQAVRSEGAAPHSRTAGSARPGASSLNSSSDASETGVVNSPMTENQSPSKQQQQQPEVQSAPPSASSAGGSSSLGDAVPLSGRHATGGPISGGTSSHGGRVGSSSGTPHRLQTSSSNGFGRQVQQGEKQQPQAEGPLKSARSLSSNGFASCANQQPPKSAGIRAGSLGGISGSLAMPKEACTSSDLPSFVTSQTHRAAGSFLALASQSCQLLGQYGPATCQSSSTSLGPHSSSSYGPRGLSGPGLRSHNSCKASIAGSSCTRLSVLNQEDVPLLALKPTPGRVPRVTVSGLSSSMASTAVPESGLDGSMQQVQQVHISTEPAASATQMHSNCSNNNSSQVHQQPSHGSTAAVDGISKQTRAQYGSRLDPQYATMQSDMCNLGSWLGDAPGLSSVQQQQEQLQQEEQKPAGRHLHALTGEQQQQTSVPATPQQSGGVACHTAELGSSAARSSRATSTSSLPPAAADSPAAASHGDATGTATVAGPSSARSGRHAMLSTAWAYMSDMCNLGGSFDAGSSGSSRAGLAAVLGHLADQGNEAAGQGPVGLEGSATTAETAQAVKQPTNSRQQLSRQQQLSSHVGPAGAAAGSWPDTAPSPPHATLVSSKAGSPTSTLAAATAVAGSGAANSCTPASRAATRKAEAHETNCNAEVLNSHTEAASDAAGTPTRYTTSSRDAPIAAATRAGSEQPSPAAEEAGAGDGSPGAGGHDTEVRGAAQGLDPQLLAAVTGTSSREQLTASQEELAAKLARLAFANPTAAQQLTGKQQQQQPGAGGHRLQQQQQGSNARPAAAVQQMQQQQQLFEPFYPTMMSDICNLADPFESDPSATGNTADTDLPGHRISAAGRPPSSGRNAAPVGIKQPPPQQPNRWAAGPPPLGHGVSRLGPAAAVDGAAVGLPGRPVRLQPQPQQIQQQQQQVHPSRLGRPASGGAPPSSSTAAAGPLRAALLLRGLRPTPGMPKQVVAGPVAAAAAAQSRRMTCPGDAAGEVRAATAAGDAIGSTAAQPTYAEDSLVSFESYYPDCDLKGSQNGGCSADPAAGGLITDNPLYTFTTFDSGLLDSPRISPGYQQQLKAGGRSSSNGGSVSSRLAAGCSAPSVQQQQRPPGQVVMSTDGSGALRASAEVAAIAGKAGLPSSGIGRGGISDHDDGAQQQDKSRSSSPALMMLGDASVVASAEGKGSIKASRAYASEPASGHNASTWLWQHPDADAAAGSGADRVQR